MEISVIYLLHSNAFKFRTYYFIIFNNVTLLSYNRFVQKSFFTIQSYFFLYLFLYIWLQSIFFVIKKYLKIFKKASF